MPVNAFADFDLDDLTEVGTAGREEEALFARDDNDILVRREQETRKNFTEEVVITIDGYSVKVPRAVPKTDAMGNELRDSDGELIPRTTTIYDAAGKLVREGVWSEDELKHRLPVLCHASHLDPVAMCRMCSVHISSLKRGRLTPGRKLVPACQHRVEKDMVVTTRVGAERHQQGAESDAAKAIASFAQGVNSCVSMLAEFLLADHRQPEATPEKRFDNELENVASTLNVLTPRPCLQRAPSEVSRNRQGSAFERSRRIELPIAPTPFREEELAGDRRQANADWARWNQFVDERFPYSSPTVVVDHDRCILCDRCARSCSEVRPFKVIGHTGKGYQTRISFDLDALMRDSSCVQCGECMNSCPTGALSLRRRVQPRAWDDSPEQIPLNPNTPFPAGSEFLTADQMQAIWLVYKSPTRGSRIVYPFRSIPYAYLKWNEGAVRRWVIPANEQRVLCREGEYGSTAFLLQGTGKFHIHVRGGKKSPESQGFLARLFGRGRTAEGLEHGTLVRTIPGHELVLGEMACLTHKARNATVIAEADPEVPNLELAMVDGKPTAIVREGEPSVVVYEITRNMLDMLQRSASAREDIEEIYSTRALETAMLTGTLLAKLTREQRVAATRFLLNARRGDGKPAVEYRFVEPGETVVAQGDPVGAFYVVRLGFLRVEQVAGSRNLVINLLKANDHFGEIALLADDLRRTKVLPPDYDARMRSASVTAIDASELIRVPGPLFTEMCNRFPDVKALLLENAALMFGPKAQPEIAKERAGLLTDYVNQGLFQAQKMLALDLTRCTRCDECTRACADSHPDHNARLLREGLRFGDFLAATSCRSCHTPYCMELCPVDAIHRKGDHLEVLIEDHCIGCSLCERNCPYGSIQMVPNPKFSQGGPAIAGFRTANNCDLCNGDTPFCVAACPHDAAFRVNGEDLLTKVAERAAGGKLTVF